uniref:Uncharacterized protein n=2 Tax=Rhodosorus marinus TaxID=101924 RepID=A0A7S2ZL25_9RHOD
MLRFSTQVLKATLSDSSFFFCAAFLICLQDSSISLITDFSSVLDEALFPSEKKLEANSSRGFLTESAGPSFSVNSRIAAQFAESTSGFRSFRLSRKAAIRGRYLFDPLVPALATENCQYQTLLPKFLVCSAPKAVQRPLPHAWDNG